MEAMIKDIELLIPKAKDYAEKVALAEAEEAMAEMKRQKAAEAEKAKLVDAYLKPSGVSDEERIKRARVIIERAVKNRLTEVQFYRFPSDLCTDKGRAINQAEPGWEKTLVGLPKELYEFWNRYLREQGYKLKVEIVDFPDGMPGDVGMTLKWD
jgi:hypothetical protein